MSYTVRDGKGTEFTVDVSGKGDRVGVTVGKGLYTFTPSEARALATALEYTALCAEEIERWLD
jgi:hypothetical protein